MSSSIWFANVFILLSEKKGIMDLIPKTGLNLFEVASLPLITTWKTKCNDTRSCKLVKPGFWAKNQGWIYNNFKMFEVTRFLDRIKVIFSAATFSQKINYLTKRGQQMLSILGFISRWMFRPGKHFFCRNCLEHISAWLEFTFPHEKGSWSEFGTFAKWRLTCSLAIKKSEKYEKERKDRKLCKKRRKIHLDIFSV